MASARALSSAAFAPAAFATSGSDIRSTVMRRRGFGAASILAQHPTPSSASAERPSTSGRRASGVPQRGRGFHQRPLSRPPAAEKTTPNGAAPLAPGTVISQLREGRGASASSLTAFIFESFPSCAGQVVLPRGWLRAAVAEARRDAAERRGPPPVVIADEVQTGLGRLGPLEANSFWAFQHFGVPSPDIVTIGKPAANGFPFGAVVASRRVAAAFAGRHPPFFSTFGGCTAAAAAALATLGALRQERLPERAAEVGAWLLAELKRMAAALLLEEGDGRNERIRRSKLIIDVRGVGLMLGVEVAFGKERSFAAAPRVAAFVAAHCRDASRVLISCDGAGPRAGSVLKIKPPLCFDLADAEELVGALRAGFEAVPAELLLLP